MVIEKKWTFTRILYCFPSDGNRPGPPSPETAARLLMQLTWPTFPLLVLAAAVAIYSAAAALAWLFQRHLVHHPRRNLRQTPRDIDAAFEDLRLTTEDGVRIHAWYVPCETARATVLFCHGNGGNIGDRLETLRLFRSLELNALIFDYRGYGESEGVPDEAGTYRDAERCWRHLVDERGLVTEPIFLFGRSLGAAVAVDLATRVTCAGLVLESPFTSLPDVGKKHYPWLPVSLFSRSRYASLEKIGSVSCPVLIAHSPDDDVIPFSHGERLHEAARPPKYFVRLTGTHKTGFILSGQSYERALRAFVLKCLAGNRTERTSAETPPPSC